MRRKEWKAGDRVRVYMPVLDYDLGVAVRNATIEMPGERLSPEGRHCLWVCVDRPVVISCSHDGEEMTEHSRFWVPAQCVRRLKRRKAKP